MSVMYVRSPVFRRRPPLFVIEFSAIAPTRHSPTTTFFVVVSNQSAATTQLTPPFPGAHT